MKIAIVGGGFYGCYIATKILELKQNHKITIYEKNNKILSEAAINNQYRLHKGFHYPRSKKTIEQTLKGSRDFMKEFNKYVFFPKNNIYAIHLKSKIKFKNYISVFKSYNLKFHILNKKYYSKYFSRPNEIEGAIKVDEGVISLEKLYTNLKKKLKKINIKTNTRVQNISSGKGLVHLENRKEKFDLIINCTYINPNMGLKKNYYKLKYELASMVHVKNSFGKEVALTIMDGKFVSAYPINNNIITLSSVKFTPVKKFNSLNEYLKFLKNKKKYKKILNNSKKIILDVRKFIKLPTKVFVKKITYSPKVKIINDMGDRRLANVKFEKKLISVLCGKIDAVGFAWKTIEEKYFF